jgi:hypothetical protein
MNIMQRPGFYLKYNVSETEFYPHIQVEQTQLDPTERDRDYQYLLGQETETRCNKLRPTEQAPPVSETLCFKENTERRIFFISCKFTIYSTN